MSKIWKYHRLVIDVVYFEVGKRYGNAELKVVRVGKTHLIFTVGKGRVKHSRVLDWRRLKGHPHPVQFVHWQGKLVWAVDKRD